MYRVTKIDLDKGKSDTSVNSVRKSIVNSRSNLGAPSIPKGRTRSDKKNFIDTSKKLKGILLSNFSGAGSNTNYGNLKNSHKKKTTPIKFHLDISKDEVGVGDERTSSIKKPRVSFPDKI